MAPGSMLQVSPSAPFTIPGIEVDMKLSVKVFLVGAIFSILVSACNTYSNDFNQDSGIDSGEVILEELPDEFQDLIAQEEILPEFPIMTQLTVSPQVANPGDLVTLVDPLNLAGTVTITHGGFTESLNLSSGAFAVPLDAPDGVYSILLENEEGTIGFGALRVASAPGIWISSSGKYASVDEYVEIRVTTHQLPQDMFAIFRLGDLAQDPLSEDDYSADFEDFDPFAFDGPSTYLLPNQDGVLQPGNFPGAPLSEIVDQTLLLPGRLANQIQVYALEADLAGLMSEGFFAEDDAYEEDYQIDGMGLASNIVSVQQCDLEGEIKGNLGGPGTIRAISLDGDLAARILSVEGGGFSLQVPAGKVMIEGWQDNEEGRTYFQAQAIEVPCGESVQASFAAASLPRLASIIPAAEGTNNAAKAEGGSEICERIFVNSPGALPDDFGNPAPLISAYTAQLESLLSRASVASDADIQNLLKQSAQDQLGGGNGQEQIKGIRDILSADIVIFSYIYRLGERQFASVAAFDKSNGWGGSFARASFYGETIQELSRLPDSFVEKIQKAAICATVEPPESVIGPNETVDLIIEMTDLDGEAHEEVEVSLESMDPLCGALEWNQQIISSPEITNQYTANDELSCEDTLVFVGETKGPQGMIKSNSNHAIAKILKPLMFHFNMKMTFYGEQGGTIDFNWDADFYADEKNNVNTVTRSWDPDAASGAFTGQGIHCEVHENGVLTFRSEDLKPNASWDLELGGKMEVFENGFVDVKLTPVGTSWDFDMQPFPEDCTLLIENLFIWFMRSISLNPANFVPGGAIEFGGLTDEPLKINIPLEGSSGFDVTITRAPVQARQP